MSTKTPIALVQPASEQIEDKRSVVNYTKEILRNPFDTANSTSKAAIALLPEQEKFIIEAHFNRSQDLFRLSEKVLTNRMEQMGYKVSSTENLLRNRFWLEYDHAVTGGFSKMRIEEIIRGVCSFSFFRETFLANAYLVAYLMLPPINFKAKQEETLLYALDKLRAVLDIDAIGPNNQVDTKVIRAQLAIYQILEKRVQGEVMQKVAHAHALVPLQPSTQSEVEAVSEEQMLAEMQEMLSKQKARNTTKAALHSDIFVTTARPVKDDDGE